MPKHDGYSLCFVDFCIVNASSGSKGVGAATVINISIVNSNTVRFGLKNTNEVAGNTSKFAVKFNGIYIKAV